METILQRTIADDISKKYKVEIGGKPIGRAVLHTPEEIRAKVGDELSVKIFKEETGGSLDNT